MVAATLLCMATTAAALLHSATVPVARSRTQQRAPAFVIEQPQPLARIQQRRHSPLAMREEEETGGSWLSDAWQKYVLIRPGMDFDELKNSTRLRTSKSWNWSERTPGTARTIVLSALIVTAIAIPVLLTNPLVLANLLEFAALSRAGVTPAEVSTRRRSNPKRTRRLLFALLAPCGRCSR